MVGAPGDVDLASLCAREHPRLVGLLALMVADRRVAEELAQEALLRLCDRWPTVRGHDVPEAWLTRVAVNLAVSNLRRRAAERRAYARHGRAPDSQAFPERADVLAVRAAVAALPTRQRTAIVYRFFAEFTVAETAVAMKCRPGTVTALTSQGVSALRQVEAFTSAAAVGPATSATSTAKEPDHA